jgi:hypothetical protein
MSLLTQLAISTAVYGDSAKESNCFSLKVPDRSLDVFTLESNHRVQMAGSATNASVSFQSITNGQLITLKSDKTFTVKFNGTSGTELTIKPRTDTGSGVVTPAFLVMMSNGITSLYLGNPNSEVITVDVGIAGT